MNPFRTAALAFLLIQVAAAAPEIAVVKSDSASAFPLVDANQVVSIVVDSRDYPVVALAAGMFAGDIERVTGRHAAVVHELASGPSIIVGTLGHSALIDQLAASGKLQNLDTIRGHWETTLWQVVDRPMPNVERALVIVGSDRRGAAYGLMTLSGKIGVSPWVWWADVPARHATTLGLAIAGAQTDAPAVKYRGIFINDEDWGLNPWAAKTFDPGFGNIGPKTYEKVFELMLRLRLNYLWPAMHACTAEFASQPANIELADRYGIVAGSSHCEPMLCNNIHWDEKTQGRWDYTLNRDAIHAYWAESAKTRGSYEAVWTLGIRGIHDQSMEGPPEIPTRIKTVTQVLADQRALLKQYVAPEWGAVAQAFVPYKEVLPIYDAGLQVPDDVTLVWVDDNFGYIRRLSAPAERRRSGGAGVYWHLSYYGSPHSYTWINTTAPGLMWEELHKAWENDARRLWVINVGDIKPMEIGMDYFARFAWSAPTFGPNSQPVFLSEFAKENFGEALAEPVSQLLADFYRLGTTRKPELMERRWALGLTPREADDLDGKYRQLLRQASALSTLVNPAARDAFFETVVFPAQVLADTGLIFLADRRVQLGENVAENEAAIARLRDELTAAVDQYNTRVAGGKWNHMMPGLVTGTNLMIWSSQVRWPWGEKPGATAMPVSKESTTRDIVWRDAADVDETLVAEGAHWTPVAGLGSTGRAMALLPAADELTWKTEDPHAPTLTYRFNASSTGGSAIVEFLPTFRLYPGKKLRVAVVVDDQPPQVVEVPGSSGAEDEVGRIRQAAVQDNFVRATIPLPALTAGPHTLKIRAIDPGAIVNRIALPTKPATRATS